MLSAGPSRGAPCRRAPPAAPPTPRGSSAGPGEGPGPAIACISSCPGRHAGARGSCKILFARGTAARSSSYRCEPEAATSCNSTHRTQHAGQTYRRDQQRSFSQRRCGSRSMTGTCDAIRRIRRKGARLGPAGVIQVHMAGVLRQVHSSEGHLTPHTGLQGPNALHTVALVNRPDLATPAAGTALHTTYTTKTSCARRQLVQAQDKGVAAYGATKGGKCISMRLEHRSPRQSTPHPQHLAVVQHSLVVLFARREAVLKRRILPKVQLALRNSSYISTPVCSHSCSSTMHSAASCNVRTHLLWPVHRLLRLVKLHQLGEGIGALQPRLLCTVKVGQLGRRADGLHAQRCAADGCPMHAGPAGESPAAQNAARQHRHRGLAML